MICDHPMHPKYSDYWAELVYRTLGGGHRAPCIRLLEAPFFPLLQLREVGDI